jgi:hypothetical protein
MPDRSISAVGGETPESNLSECLNGMAAETGVPPELLRVAPGASSAEAFEADRVARLGPARKRMADMMAQLPAVQAAFDRAEWLDDDSVVAGATHEQERWNTAAGTPLASATEDVADAYRAIPGYGPTSTD